MKGFKVTYKHKTIDVAIVDGVITIDMFHKNDESRLYVGGVDYSKSERHLWYDLASIEPGDEFEIEISKIDFPSTPSTIIKEEKLQRPKSKLELFRELENKLK